MRHPYQRAHTRAHIHTIVRIRTHRDTRPRTHAHPHLHAHVITVPHHVTGMHGPTDARQFCRPVHHVVYGVLGGAGVHVPVLAPAGPGRNPHGVRSRLSGESPVRNHRLSVLHQTHHIHRYLLIRYVFLYTYVNFPRGSVG